MNVLNTIKVLIASDQKLIREFLISILKQENNISVVKEINNKNDLLTKCDVYKPDIVLFFFSSISDSLDACKKLKNYSAPISSLILSELKTEKIIFYSLFIGADGYLTFENSSSELVEAINKIYFGDKYFGCKYYKDYYRELSQKFEHEIRNIHNLGEINLTKREKEVLNLIGKGHTSKEIAKELNISKRTVDNFRYYIMQKLGIESLASLVTYSVILSFFS